MAPQPEVMLFHYPESIYSHRVLWYLQLRGIKYSECIQPPIMPRPDLAELGIAYRKIPLLAIGHDVYCDSRIIIEALEKHFPNNGPLEDVESSDQEGIRQLFESYSIDGGVFWRAVSLLPMDTVDFLKDPMFLADREAMLGGPLDVSSMQKARPATLASLRQIFDRLEKTFLADGRDWILGTAGPTRADVDAVWAPQWLFRDPHFGGAIPAEFVSEKLYPKSFAWMDRFLETADAARAKAPEVKTLSGKDAIDRIMESGEGTGVYSVDEKDPLQLKLGERVAVNPTDMAISHVDYGKLATLKTHEVAIVNDKGVWLHFPRWNFQVQRVGTPDVSSQAVPDDVRQTKLAMRYIYHPMSPYSRKAYMFALELGLADCLNLEKVVVAPVPYKGWSDDNEEVAAFNPMAKIPTLVPEEHGDGIYDSRTICEFLEAEDAASGRKLVQDKDAKQRWRLRTLHACADGMLDAQVLLVYENKIRAENNMKLQTWIDGQTEKITRCFDRLELEASRGTLTYRTASEVATAAECAVAAGLGFLDIVKHEWRSGRPKLSEWFDHWQQRASFLTTKPDIDWKTGKSADLGFANEAIGGPKKSK